MQIRFVEEVEAEIWSFAGGEVATSFIRKFRPGEIFQVGEASPVDSDTSCLDIVGMGVGEFPNYSWCLFEELRFAFPAREAFCLN